MKINPKIQSTLHKSNIVTGNENVVVNLIIENFHFMREHFIFTPNIIEYISNSDIPPILKKRVNNLLVDNEILGIKNFEKYILDTFGNEYIDEVIPIVAKYSKSDQKYRITERALQHLKVENVENEIIDKLINIKNEWYLTLEAFEEKIRNLISRLNLKLENIISIIIQNTKYYRIKLDYAKANIFVKINKADFKSLQKDKQDYIVDIKELNDLSNKPYINKQDFIEDINNECSTFEMFSIDKKDLNQIGIHNAQIEENLQKVFSVNFNNISDLMDQVRQFIPEKDLLNAHPITLRNYHLSKYLKLILKYAETKKDPLHLKSVLEQKNNYIKSAKNYCNYIGDCYNFIRIIGMEKPIKLKDIYVRVHILEKISSNRRINIKVLEKQFDRDKRTFGNPLATKSGIEVARELDKFIVLGKPGSGKTTLLKYLTLQSASGAINMKRIPFFVSLKELCDSGKSILEHMLSNLIQCGFVSAKTLLLQLLNMGHCQILLDGLDEVNIENENNLIKEIIYISDKYNNNQFIISCRIAAYNQCFPKFTDVEIADFTDEQINIFITNWFKDEPDISKLCWNKLNESPQTKELASIPLLLTLLCIAFDETFGFPQNRAELYKEAIDALLKKWDASRRIKREEIYKYFSPRRKETMFAEIAYLTFIEDEYFLHQRTLENYISDYIINLPYDKGKTIEFDSEAVLKAIEAQHGIFVERAKGIYSFSHLTFQEYFAAKYCIENPQEHLLLRLVENHIADDKWREIFLLSAGMLHKADIFFLLMHKQIQKISYNNNVSPILKKIENSITSNKLFQIYPKPFSRAILFGYSIMNELAISFSNTFQDINNFYSSIDRCLENNNEYIDNLVQELSILINDFINKKHFYSQIGAIKIFELVNSISRELLCARDLSIEITVEMNFEEELSLISNLLTWNNKTQNFYYELIKNLEEFSENLYVPNELNKTFDNDIIQSDLIFKNEKNEFEIGKISSFEENEHNYSIENESQYEYDYSALEEEIYDNILTIIDQIKNSIDQALNVVDKLRKDSFVRISYEHREKVLLEYITANKLLLDCLNTDCYVSKNIRFQILDEFMSYSKQLT